MINKDLVVGAVSLDIALGDRKLNISRVKHVLDCWGDKLNVMVLPEMFSTGFLSDENQLNDVSEDDEGPTVRELQQLSEKYDVLLSGSYISKVSGSYYNRGFLLAPDGRQVFYNKRHLFGLSEESQLFVAGKSKPPVIEYLGWRIAIVICYDLRFPVWCRRHDDHCQYDILLVVANWPQTRMYAWQHLLIARAIENQSYVVGDNRSGSDQYGEYDGMSVIYDMVGLPIGQEV